MATIEAFGLTDVGKKRKHNEDAYALDAEEGLFVVAETSLPVSCAITRSTSGR
jgi:serine/threonine protein phosphatase PrpC